jgi:hypothetical protein
VGGGLLNGTLPRCANHSMPQLEVRRGEPEGDGGLRLLPGAALSQAAAPAATAPLAGLAAALVGTGIATATAALLWRRRRAGRPAGERHPLLLLPLAQRGAPTPPHQRADGAASQEGHLGRAGVAAALPLQRARLAQLLQRHAAGGGGRLELLPLPVLSAAVAHQMNDGGGCNAAGAASGLGADTATEPSDQAQQRGVAVQDRQWGLDTASLQLQEQELEVRGSCVWRLGAGGSGGLTVGSCFRWFLFWWVEEGMGGPG